jgi:hypothetical protein
MKLTEKEKHTCMSKEFGARSKATAGTTTTTDSKHGREGAPSSSPA